MERKKRNGKDREHVVLIYRASAQLELNLKAVPQCHMLGTLPLLDLVREPYSGTDALIKLLFMEQSFFTFFSNTISNNYDFFHNYISWNNIIKMTMTIFASMAALAG